MTISRLIVIVVVVGLVAWLLTYLPLPEPFRTILWVLLVVGVIVGVIIWLLRYAGLDRPL